MLANVVRVQFNEKSPGAHQQKTAFECATIPKRKPLEEAIEDALAVQRHLRQLAKGKRIPVLAQGQWFLLPPGCVAADAGDAREEIEVAHHLTENNGRNRFERLWRQAADEAQRAGSYQEVDKMPAHFAFVPRKIDLVLDLEAELRQLQGGRIVRVPLAHQPVRPTALVAEGGEYVLAQNMPGETVGVRSCLPLGIGDQVQLAVSLFEGLADAVVLEPAAPVQNGLDWR